MIDLATLRNVDVRTVDRSMLVDLQEVCINDLLPHRERILQLFQIFGNPYCYKFGDIVIKESFSDNGKTMRDCLEQYIDTLV